MEDLDLETNISTVYKSMREVARNLKTHLSTLLKRERNETKKPFRGRYIISIKRS